jgi:hypothetical protein
MKTKIIRAIRVIRGYFPRENSDNEKIEYAFADWPAGFAGGRV